jgi:hypothetical protein
MSYLFCPLWGHKRTFAVQNGMSALPPKAAPASKIFALVDVESRMQSRAANVSQFLQRSRTIGRPSRLTCSVASSLSLEVFKTALSQGAIGLPVGPLASLRTQRYPGLVASRTLLAPANKVRALKIRETTEAMIDHSTNSLNDCQFSS